MPTGAPSWGTGHVTGEWHSETGEKLSGRYQIHIPVRVMNSSDEVIIPSGLFARGRLNMDTGVPSLTMDVPATDDPDNLPRDWVVRIHIDFDKVSDGYQPHSETYYLHIPEGSVIDLSTVLPSDPHDPRQPDPGLIRGVPGGVAGLDADGDVNDARGRKVVPGMDGAKGDKGDTGPAGPQGAKGDTGEKGDKGEVGATGATGPAGPQGARGDTGAKGDTGATGPAGATGPQGAKGDTGATGPQGAKGDTGAAGPAGPQGDVGPAGPQGDAGEKGDKGDAGESPTLENLPAGSVISRKYTGSAWEARGTNRTDLTCIYRASGTDHAGPTDAVSGQDVLLAPSPWLWDSFTRSSSSLWGTADDGRGWSKLAGDDGNFTVDGSRGVIALPNSATTVRRIQHGSSANHEALVTMTPNVVASGGTILSSLITRFVSGSAFYNNWLYLDTDGKFWLEIRRGGTLIKRSNTKYSYAAGQSFKLRARVNGSDLAAKVWDASTSEPLAWTLTASDSEVTGEGGIALQLYANSGNDNSSGDLKVFYDDFWATDFAQRDARVTLL